MFENFVRLYRAKQGHKVVPRAFLAHLEYSEGIWSHSEGIWSHSEHFGICWHSLAASKKYNNRLKTYLSEKIRNKKNRKKKQKFFFLVSFFFQKRRDK